MSKKCISIDLTWGALFEKLMKTENNLDISFLRYHMITGRYTVLQTHWSQYFSPLPKRQSTKIQQNQIKGRWNLFMTDSTSALATAMCLVPRAAFCTSLTRCCQNSSTLHTHTHAHMHTRTRTRTRAHAQTHKRTHAHAHMHTHTQHAHAHTHTRTGTHAHTHTHTHTRAHTHTCIHTHTHTRMHTHTHTHEHASITYQ